MEVELAAPLLQQPHAGRVMTTHASPQGTVQHRPSRRRQARADQPGARSPITSGARRPRATSSPGSRHRVVALVLPGPVRPAPGSAGGCPGRTGPARRAPRGIQKVACGQHQVLWLDPERSRGVQASTSSLACWQPRLTSTCQGPPSAPAPGQAAGTSRVDRPPSSPEMTSAPARWPATRPCPATARRMARWCRAPLALQRDRPGGGRDGHLSVTVAVPIAVTAAAILRSPRVGSPAVAAEIPDLVARDLDLDKAGGREQLGQPVGVE
jgi:hypothetical protein